MLLGSLIGIGAAIAFAVLAGLVASDARGWIPYLSWWVVQRAARQLPADRRARAAEEWTADVNEFEDRPMSMLIVAMRIALRARTTAREVRPVTVMDLARDLTHRASAIKRRMERPIGLRYLLIFVSRPR
jgi:hypothetical protein